MTESPTVSRRDLLVAGGSAVLLGGCLGDPTDATPTADGPPRTGTADVTHPDTSASEVVAEEFGDVIDVSEHGFPGDGSGGDLAAFVAEHAGDARFELPDGTYRWERPLHFTGGEGTYDEPIPERIAIVGESDVTIEAHMPPTNDRHDRRLFTFGYRNAPVPVVALENLHVDIGDADPDRDAGIMRANVRDRMDARNVSLSRRCRLNPDGSVNGDRHTYKCDVVSESGAATHREIDLTAGDVHVEAADDVGHAIPFASEPNHVGTNRWIDCRVAGYTDNGFYLRDGVGSNVMVGCLARNCGGGNIRLGYNDEVRDCRVVLDGTEAPAHGCALWVQEAEETTVDGLDIHAPTLANDAIRTTGDLRSGSIRNVSVLQGGTEYAIKATGNVGTFTFENIDVEDRGDGSKRVASVYVSQDDTTFRDVSVRNRDHGARNGHANLCVAGENVTFVDCDLLTDNPYGVILGTPFRSGTAVGVTFDGCRFANAGSSEALIRFAGRPDLRAFRMRACTVSDYLVLIEDGSVLDFDSGTVEDTDIDP